MLMSLLWLGEAHSFPIVNGVVEEGFPTVLALGAEFNDNAFSACTGNLITPKIVLTAAHCGGELPLSVVIELGAAFVATEVTSYEHKLSFKDYVIHPEYRELGTNGPYDTGSYDVSLLILEDEAPIEPTLFRSEVITEEDHGIALKAVGFGITSASGNDSGTKRSADVILTDTDNMFVLVENADNEDNANICSGDSGGPTFFFDEIRDQYVQLGVHSWGDQSCLYQSGSTRTDLISEWIFDTIEDVHGSRDICEVNGYYTDGICTELPDCLMEDPECIVEEELPKGACSVVGTDTYGLWLVGLMLLFPYTRKRETHHLSTT